MRSLAAHPIRKLLGAGVPVTVNADDVLMFNTTILAEYEHCRRELGMSDEERAAAARASVNHSGASADLVSTAIQQIDAWLMDPAICK